MADDVLPEFDYALRLPIFLCHLCHTHFAIKMQERLTINVERLAIFFPPLKCINLLVDPPENHFLTQTSKTWVARVFCRGFNTMMGYKIVHEDNPDRPHQEGTVIMDVNSVLLWDGHESPQCPQLLVDRGYGQFIACQLRTQQSFKLACN